MKIPWPALGALAGIALILPGSSSAFETITREKPIAATQVFGGTTVAFKPGGIYKNVTLIVTGPADYQAEVFKKDGIPSISLERFGKAIDGTFSYHMTAATTEISQIINPGLNNGRDDIPGTKAVGAALSGQFCIKNGVIAEFDPRPEDQFKTGGR